MGLYLTSAELNLHEWRVRLREAQQKLKDTRRGKNKVEIQGAEAHVKWILRRTASAQITVDSERERRLRLANSLIGVPEGA